MSSIRQVFWLLLLTSMGSYAATTTSKTIDTIKNSTGGSGLSVPSSGTTFDTDSNSLTLTNKTISGSSNTLSNIGDSSLSVSYIKADGTRAFSGSQSLGSNAITTSVANAGTTGTTANKLAKLTGAPSTAIISATTDTGGILGVVVSGAGTTGSAEIARSGQVSCVFDGATTAGDYVQISSTTGGDCHDAGSTLPTSGQILGRVLSTNASGGTYAIVLNGSEITGYTTGGGGGSKAAWSGYHGNDCSWVASSTSGFVDPGIDNTCTFTQRQNFNTFGTVTSYNDGTTGNNLPGFVFTPKASGTNYLICANFGATYSTASQAYGYQLNDTAGSPVVISELGVESVSAIDNLNQRHMMCGLYTVSDTSAHTIRIQMRQTGGSNTITTNSTFNSSIEWTIHEL